MFNLDWRHAKQVTDDGTYRDSNKWVTLDQVEELITQLEGEAEKMKMPEYQDMPWEQKGYNQAVDDFINLIKKYKEGE